MFGIFKGFTEFIFGPAVKVKSPTETEAPYKVEQPPVSEPVSVEAIAPSAEKPVVLDSTPAQPSLVSTAAVEVPAKKPRKPRSKTKVAVVPAKKPKKAPVVSIAEAKKGKGKSKKS